MPVVFGILAFVYAGHGVFPAIQASMEQPKDFPKASRIAEGAIIRGNGCTCLCFSRQP